MGVLADRDILEHICYDGHDSQMLEMLKPCIDEGFAVQHREVSIAKETLGQQRLTLIIRLRWILLAVVAIHQQSQETGAFDTHRRLYKKNYYHTLLSKRATRPEKRILWGI
jgi:hypothetical protein